MDRRRTVGCFTPEQLSQTFLKAIKRKNRMNNVLWFLVLVLTDLLLFRYFLSSPLQQVSRNNSLVFLCFFLYHLIFLIFVFIFFFPPAFFLLGSLAVIPEPCHALCVPVKVDANNTELARSLAPPPPMLRL